MADLINSPAHEVWKPIPSLAGFEASTLGRVRGSKRPGGGRVVVTRVFHGEVLATGYHAIRVGRKRHLVHRLICEAFAGPPAFAGATVDHVDGNRRNNAPENLEWVTRSENSRRQNADGRGAPKGELHPVAKLTDFQAANVRRLREQGWGVPEIARLFCVSGSLIYKILQGVKRPHCHGSPR